jgi:hypothetical protein
MPGITGLDETGTLPIVLYLHGFFYMAWKL